MGIRVTRPGRKHGIGIAHILAALTNASFVEQQAGDRTLYIGTDDRGVELEIVVIPDNRRPAGNFVVIHAMPTHFRRP